MFCGTYTQVCCDLQNGMRGSSGAGLAVPDVSVVRLKNRRLRHENFSHQSRSEPEITAAEASEGGVAAEPPNRDVLRIR